MIGSCHAPLRCIILVLTIASLVRGDGFAPPGSDGFAPEAGIFSTNLKQKFDSYKQLVKTDTLEGHMGAARRHKVLANEMAQQHQWKIPFPGVKAAPSTSGYSDGLAFAAGPPTPAPKSELKTYVQLAKIHRLEGKKEQAAREEIFANDIALANHLELPFPSSGTSEVQARETHEHHDFVPAQSQHQNKASAAGGDDDGKGESSKRRLLYL
jgi:hypothetical protein